MSSQTQSTVSAGAAAPSPFPEIDRKVARVAAHKTAWTQVSLERRAELVDACKAALESAAQSWADSTCHKRGLIPGTPGAAEPWLTEIVPTMRNLRLLSETLRAGGRKSPPKVWTRAGGQKVVQTFPCDGIDAALFMGLTAETWIMPGEEATTGKLYADKAAGRGPEGLVSLVLGAGNVGSICPMDALHKLFAEDQVVVVKTNPVNAYLTPSWEAMLQPLVDEGVVTFIDGGPEEGAYLCQHPEIESIHITGSHRTYDAIVWGPDPETQAQRKASGERLNTRHVSAELGCVTPILVTPGQWSEADLRYQAQNIVSMVTNNASFNCVAGKLLITAKNWPQREAFLDALRRELRRIPPRQAYYPGAEQRFAAFAEHYPQCERLGAEAEGAVPWSLVADVPADGQEYAMQNEAFCGILAETALDADGPADFLRKAVAFANDEVWGTLSAIVICDGKTQKAQHDALEQALADLRYGGVALNVWSGLIYGMAAPPWGAYPGHSAEDIVSGVDFVHNTYMLDHPQKTVMRAPFRIWPTPAWFDGFEGAMALSMKIFQLEKKRSWLSVPGVAFAAMRG